MPGALCLAELIIVVFAGLFALAVSWDKMQRQTPDAMSELRGTFYGTLLVMTVIGLGPCAWAFAYTDLLERAPADATVPTPEQDEATADKMAWTFALVPLILVFGNLVLGDAPFPWQSLSLTIAGVVVSLCALVIGNRGLVPKSDAPSRSYRTLALVESLLFALCLVAYYANFRGSTLEEVEGQVVCISRHVQKVRKNEPDQNLQVTYRIQERGRSVSLVQTGRTVREGEPPPPDFDPSPGTDVRVRLRMGRWWDEPFTMVAPVRPH